MQFRATVREVDQPSPHALSLEMACGEIAQMLELLGPLPFTGERLAIILTLTATMMALLVSLTVNAGRSTFPLRDDWISGSAHLERSFPLMPVGPFQ